jgi:site-specific recombinase XerC
MNDSTEATAADITVWHLLPNRWRQTLRAKAMSPLTERGYLSTARRWADWLLTEGLDLEPEEVRDCHIDDFIAGIVVATSAANAAFHYRNLRVYFGWLVKRKEITTRNPMATTEPPKAPEKLTPVFTANDRVRLMEACVGGDFLALRDKAVILLFTDTGARVSEIAKLDLDSITLESHLARVVGKGNKERLVGYSPDTVLVLARYLKARKKLAAERGVASSRLLLGQWGRPLSVHGVQMVLRRRGDVAGVSKVHAHRFRHTYAHDWKVNQGSNEGLMATGGWSSSKMAEHYGKVARASRALAEQQQIMFVRSVAHDRRTEECGRPVPGGHHLAPACRA